MRININPTGKKKTKKKASSRAKAATPPPPAAVHPALKIATGDNDPPAPKFSVKKVWTTKLGRSFTPISSYFLRNYHRLKYPPTPTELALIVHLLSFKWGESPPRPSFKTLADRIGRSPEAIRQAARSLEGKKYLERTLVKGRPNLFHLEPLFKAVEELYDADEAAKKAEKKASRRA